METMTRLEYLMRVELAKVSSVSKLATSLMKARLSTALFLLRCSSTWLLGQTLAIPSASEAP